MNKGDAVNKIFSCLLALTSDQRHDFSKFSSSWGHRGSTTYNENLLDFGNKVRALAMDTPILCHEGKFFIFDGRIYVSISEDVIETAYNDLIERLRIAPMIDKHGYCKNHFIRTISYYNEFCPRADLIAFTNGVLDLRDYEFHDFHQRYHVTYMLPYNYNPKAKYNRWRNFLHEVLPDKNSRVILQMYMGLGLMERSTVYNRYEGKDLAKVELCLILIGSGGNGKSTISNVIKGVLGPDRISTVDYEDLTAPGDEGMRNRLLLHDAIFNWSEDSDYRTFGRKRTGVFKRLVSGESVTIRKLTENVKEEHDIPFLIFNLNASPCSDDHSLGFLRRLQFVDFEIAVPKEKQNPALERELTEEYSGIFNWILKGCRELKRRKFVFPPAGGSRKQMLRTQLQMNPVLAWVNAYQMRWDMRAKNENFEYISTKDMLDSLGQFCIDNNVEMVSKQKFGHTMARIGNGFYKKHYPEGFRYQVFGCTAERLKEHFVIEEASMAVEYVEEKGTFIDEDD